MYSNLKTSEKENYKLLQENQTLKEANKIMETKSTKINETNIKLESELGNLKVTFVNKYLLFL